MSDFKNVITKLRKEQDLNQQEFADKVSSEIFTKEQKRKDSYKRSVSPLKLKEEIDRLNVMFQKGRVTEEYYEEQYKDLTSKLSELHDEEKSLEIEPLQNMMNLFTSNWLEMYSELDKAHKQVFWKRVIKEINVNEETHKISGFTLNI